MTESDTAQGSLAQGSLAQLAYTQLRRQLISGALLPGERIKISTLSKSMALNHCAMREALSRLTSEGLVVAEPHRGFLAAPVSAAELRDLTRARIAMELLCLRSAMEHGDVAWEARIMAAFHAISRTPKVLPGPPGQVVLNPEWFVYHAEYHRALCSACDSVWLLRLREQLFTQSERYLQISSTTMGRRRAADDEHGAITKAVLARDIDLAGALMTSHLELTSAYVLDEAQKAAEPAHSPHCPAPAPNPRASSPAFG